MKNFENMIYYICQKDLASMPEKDVRDEIQF